MNGYWENGQFILASIAQDKIARLETKVRELEAEVAKLKQQVHDLSANCASYECTIDLLEIENASN